MLSYLNSRITNLTSGIDEAKNEVSILASIRTLLTMPPPILSGFGYTGFTTREPEEDETVIDTAPYIIDKPGKYILMQDLLADDSAIAIVCNDVTLDLNGQTILYGIKSRLVTRVITYNSLQDGNVGHAGISCPDRPDATRDWTGVFGWNKHYTGVSITNGKIVDGSSEGLSYSYGMNAGGLLFPTIKNLLIETNAPDSSSIRVGSITDISYCTFIHNTDKVSNRHQQLGTIIVGNNSDVSLCRFVDSPQMCVKTGHDCIVHDNSMNANATASNAFAVANYNKRNLQCYHNHIDSTGNVGGGQGLRASHGATNTQIIDNDIKVKNPANSEYSSMRVYGIQIEDAYDSFVSRNNATAYEEAGGKPATLRFTSIKKEAKNTVTQNTFKAVGKGVACSIHSSDLLNTTISDNVFESEYAVVGCESGCKNALFDKCALIGKENSPVAKLNPYRGHVDVEFCDCTYDGVDPRKALWSPAYIEWLGDSHYKISWSAIITGQPREIVKVTSATGNEETVILDDDGKISLRLVEFDAELTPEDRVIIEREHNPYIISGQNGSEIEAIADKPQIVVDIR